jgi:hypothetical protein
VANLSMFLKPKPTLSDQDVRHGLRMMTWEGIASLAMFSVTTSGLLAGFVLALGANNFQIGILAAIPFIMQLLQIPSLWLVEQLRWRKAISVLSWLPAQLIWVLVALIPFYVGVPSQAAVGLLLGLMVVRGLLSAVTNCSWNSWIRDLVPQSIMGSFFPSVWPGERFVHSFRPGGGFLRRFLGGAGFSCGRNIRVCLCPFGGRSLPGAG